MWIPTPLYERVPNIWLVLGLMFIAYGIYLGLDLPPSLGALIMGLFCIAYGFGIALIRSRYRKKHSADDDSPGTSE